jgi:DNA-binding MarR family transcriptional regulator
MNINREAMAGIIRTSSLLLRVAGRFFSKYVVTDVQFNILLILKEETNGLSQQTLSERLTVTKSNIVGLIDRLEKSGLVKRQSHPEDRRANCVVLTPEGRTILEKVEGDYALEVDRIMGGLSQAEKKSIISATQKVRDYLKENWGE